MENRRARTSAFVILMLTICNLASWAEQPCLHRAWTAYNANDYSGAITAADECIMDFSPAAFREQSALEAAKEPVPATGRVDNVADKKKILDRWAVNDVSTSYFVKGQSAQRLM